jgi:hypothetical protein
MYTGVLAGIIALLHFLITPGEPCSEARFLFSTFLGPIFGLALQWLSGGAPLGLQTFREADLIWIAAIVVPLVLTFFLRETGARASPTAAGR